MNEHFLYLAAEILLGAALMLSIHTHLLEGAAIVDGAFADLPNEEEPAPREQSWPSIVLVVEQAHVDLTPLHEVPPQHGPSRWS